MSELDFESCDGGVLIGRPSLLVRAPKPPISQKISDFHC
jgi:hypothetical protein